jgi:hypothetical protein
MVASLLCAIQIHLVAKHAAVSGQEAVVPGVSTYAQLGDSLAGTGKYELDGHPYLTRMPLYPGLVAATKMVAGIHWAYLLIVVQTGLSLLCGFLLNRLAYRLTLSEWLPALATVAYAFHVALQWEHLKLRETGVYELAVLAFFYFAAKAEVSRGALVAMVCACIAAYYIRATGVLMLIPLGLSAWLMPRDGLSRRLAVAALAMGAVVLAALPWQFYQSRIQGRVVTAATDVAGLNLYKGNSFAFDKVSPYVDHDDGGPLIPELVRETEPGPATEDERLRLLAERDIDQDPMRFFRKAFLRIAAYLSPLTTPLGRADLRVEDQQVVLDDYEGNFVRASRDWLAFAEQMSFFIVLFAIPLGLLGLVRGILDAGPSRRLAIASLAFLLANVASHAAITAETRYRLYLDPIFIAWTCVALAHLFGRRDQSPAG